MPSKGTMDQTRSEPFPTKHEAVKLILDIMQFAVFGRRATVDELVNGKSDDNAPYKTTTGLTDYEVREALGWLYGRGRARVVEIRNGEEVWAPIYPGERRATNTLQAQQSDPKEA